MYFNSLLHIISHKIDPDIAYGFPQRPVAMSLGVEPTESEREDALKSIMNAKVMGSDRFPVKLLKLGLRHYGTTIGTIYNNTPRKRSISLTKM